MGSDILPIFFGYRTKPCQVGPGHFSDMSILWCLCLMWNQSPCSVKFTSRQDTDFIYSIFHFLNLPSISNIRKFSSSAHDQTILHLMCKSQIESVQTVGGRDALCPLCLPPPLPLTHPPQLLMLWLHCSSTTSPAGGTLAIPTEQMKKQKSPHSLSHSQRPQGCAQTGALEQGRRVLPWTG